MHWIFYAIGAPILWALANHIDKYLLSDKYSESTKEGSVGALMIFSTFFSIFVIPILYFFDKTIFLTQPTGILFLLAAGILNATCIYIYLHALDRDEASIVVPIFQTIPIFSFIFGYIFLGEVLTRTQILGGLIILAASFILTLEIDIEEKIKLKRGILLLMLSSSACMALAMTFFKLGGSVDRFAQSLAWEHIGLLIFGIGLILVPRNRRSFTKLLKRNVGSMLALNLSGELLTVVGNILTNYALFFAPVALVLVVSGTQPLFVFLYGVLFTIFLPHISKEKITKKHIIHKIVCIALIIIGATIIGAY